MFKFNGISTVWPVQDAARFDTHQTRLTRFIKRLLNRIHARLRNQGPKGCSRGWHVISPWIAWLIMMSAHWFPINFFSSGLSLYPSNQSFPLFPFYFYFPINEIRLAVNIPLRHWASSSRDGVSPVKCIFDGQSMLPVKHEKCKILLCVSVVVLDTYRIRYTSDSIRIYQLKWRILIFFDTVSDKIWLAPIYWIRGICGFCRIKHFL